MYKNTEMNVIEWTEGARIGVADIDDQHLHLAEMINRLYQAIIARGPLSTLRPCLDELDTYARIHFDAEEQLMREHGVPAFAYETHVREHREFVERLDLLHRDLETGAPTLRMDLWQLGEKWWNLHVLTTDKKIAHAISTKDRDQQTD